LIKFVEITKNNWRECIALTVSSEQKNFIASNVYSLAEAKFETGMFPIGISQNDKLIGFAMYGNDAEKNKSWIIRFMIDVSFQKKGFGREALIKLIELLENKFAKSDIRLCVEPENLNAINFYKKYGFQQTDEKWDNELIFERKKIES
jgi:diamine N-acetyltransferase